MQARDRWRRSGSRSAHRAAGLVAGTRATLSLPIKTPRSVRLPTALELGLRWDPLILDPRPLPTSHAVDAPAGGSPSPNPAASPAGSGPGASAGPSNEPRPPGRPRPSRGPDQPTGPTVSEPPAIALVAPETPGTVVTPSRATLSHGRLRLTVGLPTEPGTYRLTTTVHGADGLAFDAATQALVPSVTVRVSRRLSVAYGVVADLAMPAGASLAVPVRLANDGILDWALPPVAGDDAIDPLVARSRPPARLVARWVLLGLATITDTTDSTAPLQVAPGSETTVQLTLTAPTVPGDYLVVLDVASPLHGSLAASGVAVGQVRVIVGPATTPAAP
jgi:hypothetical protein